MTQSKKIILLTTSLILTICLMAFFGVYALTILKNSTFNVGVKYEPEYLVKVEMGIDGANDGTGNQKIEDNEYVEIFNSSNPVSNGMYIQSMSNDTIHINSQTLTPIGANGEVHFKITSLENENSGKDLKCVIDCGSSTVDSGKIVSNETKILTISTGLDSTSGQPASSSLGMIKINLKFSEFLLDLKDLSKHDATVLYFGEAGTIETSPISGTTFYVSDINGLLKLSALVGQVDTTTTAYGADCGYKNSAGPAVTFKDATIQMLNSIDCGNTSDFTNAKTFIPIGNSSTNSFRGTFDGNDNTIKGLYIDQTTGNAGLFGYVSDAEIKNLKMQNCKIDSDGSNVGNFVGYADGVTISNCSAKETEVIGGSSNVGGILGYVDYDGATITNCYNTGSVSGASSVGGIVGFVHGGTISDCYNTGSVSGSAYGVGGIGGYVGIPSTITNCYNTGSVSSSSEYAIGGIVGYVYFGMGTTTITNCYNTGSVSGSGSVGGILGNVDEADATITNCYNTGSVSGSGSVGGIVGSIPSDGSARITNCYNKGSVSGSSNVGGIVGYVGRIAAIITNCYYLKTSSVNANLGAVGPGTAEAGSYYGTFNDSNIVDLQSGMWPSDWGLEDNQLLITVLEAYRNDPNNNGIDLKSWEIRPGENDGYPVFVITETVA